MTTINFNYDRTLKAIQKLKLLTQRRAMFADTAKSAEQEAELKARLTELAEDPGAVEGIADTARQLQALRKNREQQADKLAEIDENIGKLKFIISNELEAVEVTERVAQPEDFGL